MLGTYTTHDGFTLTAYGACYSDYGLKIEKGGETLFNSPCYLAGDSYGFNEEEIENEEDEEAAPDLITVEWDEDTWNKVLADEADTLLEGALPPEMWDDEG